MAGNAEYVIDIAAEMTGDETAAELDALTAELMGAGRGAEFFQEAIQRASRELDGAARAAAAANADLAAGNDEYRKLEAAAAQASKTVEKLGLKGDVMSRAYLEAAKASDDATRALGAQADKLQGLEAAAAGANAKEQQLADTLRNVTKVSSHVDKSLAGQAESYEKLGSSLAAIGGPVGSLGAAVVRPAQGFAKLSASIGEANAAAVLGVVGIGALAAAAVALTAALVVGIAKVSEYAITLADTARSAGLAREAFEAMNPGVAALSGTVDALNKETGLGVPALNSLAKGLLDAGESSDSMAESLRVAALAEKALGAGAGSEYAKLVAAAVDAQKAVDDAAAKSGGAVSRELTEKLDAATAAADTFANRATTKLGGVVARQMQGLDAQGKRLESNLSAIFGGLDIDDALAGLAKLVDIFDANSASGKAIKFLFEELFQPIIDGADEAATAVEAFVLGFLIGATKLYIAMKPAIKAIGEFLGLDTSEFAISFKDITAIGEALAPVLLAIAAVVGGVLLVAFGSVAAIIAAQVAVWYGVTKAVELALDMFGAVIDGIKGVADAVVQAFVGIIQPVIDFFQGEIDLSTAAVQIVMGFVNGVLSVDRAILGAFVGIWNGVVEWFRSLPFGQMGIDMINGLIAGITSGAGAVMSAVTGVMRGALNAAKAALGIHSPSSVMYDEVGTPTIDGVTTAYDDGTKEVQGAMADMLAVPPANDIVPDAGAALKQAQLSGDTATIERLQGASSPADSDAPRPGGDAGGGGPSFDGATFNFYGLADAKSAIASFEEMLDAAVEGDTAKLGAAASRGKAA